MEYSFIEGKDVYILSYLLRFVYMLEHNFSHCQWVTISLSDSRNNISTGNLPVWVSIDYGVSRLLITQRGKKNDPMTKDISAVPNHPQQ